MFLILEHDNFYSKILYWVEKGQLGLRMNLPVLKEEVSEVGEALSHMLLIRNQRYFLEVTSQST